MLPLSVSIALGFYFVNRSMMSVSKSLMIVSNDPVPVRIARF